LKKRLKERSKLRLNPKWLLLVLYAVLASVAIFYRAELLVWIKSGGAAQNWLALAVVTFLALVPVVPYGVIGAAIGAAHGFLLGGAINWLGAWGAALIMFLLVRYVFAERGRQRMARYQAVSRLNHLIDKNAFLAILFARVIPIFPSPLVNTYAALVGVPFWTFAIASALGKVPVMLLFAFVGDQLFVSWRNVLLVLGVYAVFLYLVYQGYRIWSHKKS
jgi:uncharacterized membrane protein YdjX (TVP38/TMEM64 family)